MTHQRQRTYLTLTVYYLIFPSLFILSGLFSVNGHRVLINYYFSNFPFSIQIFDLLVFTGVVSVSFGNKMD